MGNAQNQQLSNPKSLRRISDFIDEKFKWQGTNKSNSIFRGFMHGSWHFLAGIWKACHLNSKGSIKEFKRAIYQFQRYFLKYK